MSTPGIYDYLDYQEYLREWVRSRREQSSLFSYRSLAAITGIDASLLVKILQGKRHLSRKGAVAMADAIGLDTQESQYFLALVDYNKAYNDQEIRGSFDRLMALRPTDAKEIETQGYRYFQHWYFPALRSALEVVPFRGGDDPASFGRRFFPRLNADQVRETMELLSRLGMVHQDASGRWLPTEAHLSTGERWTSAAIQDYQRQVIQLAQESLAGMSRETRDISTLTVSLDSHKLELVRHILGEARQAIVRLVDGMPAQDCDSVYQLNLQFFPLVLPEAAKKRREEGA